MSLHLQLMLSLLKLLGSVEIKPGHVFLQVLCSYSGDVAKGVLCIQYVGHGGVEKLI